MRASIETEIQFGCVKYYVETDKKKITPDSLYILNQNSNDKFYHKTIMWSNIKEYQ